MAVIGQILNIKIENVTNIMTQLYNHSDIYNTLLEIKENTLTRMSNADTSISKETTKYNYSTGRKFLKRGKRTERPWNKMPRFQSEFNKKQDRYTFGCYNDSDIIDTLREKKNNWFHQAEEKKCHLESSDSSGGRCPAMEEQGPAIGMRGQAM